MLTSIMLAWSLAAAPADSILLRVLTLNDFHGMLESRQYPWSGGRPVGGMAAVKGMMDSLAAECGCPSLRLDAGDQMQGSLASNLVHGRSTVEAFNALGLDAAAIGNHELDWGVDTLAARIREAAYPWLAANVFDSATGQRPSWARAHALVETGPYRVAVIGYLTPATRSIVVERHVQGLEFRRGRSAIADALDEARAERPDFTMIVAHEGAFCDSVACVGAIVDLARELDSTEVDVIVAGHTHTLINTVVRGIPIVSARSYGTAIGIVDLVAVPGGGRRWRPRVETVYADRVRADSSVTALLAKYRAIVDTLARRPIVQLRDTLMSGRGEFPMGNVIADAQRATGRADFSVMNNGGIRRPLMPGLVTYQDLFEVQPFGNHVVVVTMTGAGLDAVLEHALEPGYPDAHVSGMTVRYDPARPVGDRVVEIRGRDGKRLDPRRFYRIAVNDFMAGGGSGYDMLRPLRPQRTGRTDLEALIDWLRRQPAPMKAPREKRWIRATP